MSSIKRNIHLLRIKRLKRILSKKGIDGILVTNLTNIRYLTGFQSSSAQLIVSEKSSILITDFRYIEAARKNLRFAEVFQFGKKPKEEFRDLLKKCGIKRIGFESSNVTFNRYRQLAHWVGEKRLLPRSDVVEDLRMIKGESEVRAIRDAIRLSEKGFRHIRKLLKIGVTEKEIALRLELFFKLQGQILDGNCFRLDIERHPSGRRRQIVAVRVGYRFHLFSGVLALFDFVAAADNQKQGRQAS